MSWQGGGDTYPTWVDDGPVSRDWELSAGGDYRRRLRSTGQEEGDPTAIFRIAIPNYVDPNAGPNYYRGAGAPHQYDFQKKGSDGSWNWADPGEHAEGESYFWNGVNSPLYLASLQKNEAERTALENARIAHPEAAGQALMRSEKSLTGGSNEDDFRQELAFYDPSTQGGLSQYINSEMAASIQQQIQQSTPEAQSARAEQDSGLFGLGDLGTLALLAGGAMLLGPAIAGVEGAGIGGISAAEAAAGMGGADALGWGTGALDVLGSTAVPGSLAAEWAALEGTPTLVMGGDVAAGGLGAFTSAEGFAGEPLFVDDAIGQGTGLNSPDTPWNTLNRTLNQTLAENPMLEETLNTAKTLNSLKNTYNTVDTLYDVLTTDPQVQQASPLQQAAVGRGYMTQPFGNRNFDAYR